MEATLFTGWIYDFLTPYAAELKVAHPAMLKAITVAKKKNDQADAEMIADLLRVNLLPECYMLSEEIRELRRILRYRNHLVQEIGDRPRFIGRKTRNRGLSPIVTRLLRKNEKTWSVPDCYGLLFTGAFGLSPIVTDCYVVHTIHERPPCD